MNDHIHTGLCKQLIGNLSDFMDGDLTEELCVEIEEHLKNCENCRIVVNTLRKTIELYKQPSGPFDLPDHVRERLFLKLQLREFLKKA
jgi:predicted anti-sigma-YlaC factor YlaD